MVDDGNNCCKAPTLAHCSQRDDVCGYISGWLNPDQKKNRVQHFKDFSRGVIECTNFLVEIFIV